MKMIGILFASSLVACGSSAKPEPAEPASAPPVEGRAEVDASIEVAASTDPEPAAPPVFAMPIDPPAPPPITAVAELMAVSGGAAIGSLRFELHGDEVRMTGAFRDLSPGLHAMYIHERGDCARKGVSPGRHLDPTRSKHGPPSSSVRHAGDLGDLTVGDDGVAAFAMSTDSVVLTADRPDSVLGRTVVIHARKDDRRGDGGAAIACGVVFLR